MSAMRELIVDIFTNRATGRYGLSDVNQLQHGLQAATRAERDGETVEMIVAALLHDIGHMVHEIGDNPAAEGIDDRHEELGAQWLARSFPLAVTEPIRLHVPAKRYLCAVDKTYFGKLSQDSVTSLSLQGGFMTDAEVAEFERLPWFREAVRLRRLDEMAKDPELETPPFDYFLPLIDRVLARSVVV